PARTRANDEKIDVEGHGANSPIEAGNARLEVDALLLHLLSRPRHDIGRQLLAPRPGERRELLQEDRLGGQVSLAGGAVEESGDVLQLLVGHLRGEELGRLSVQMLSALVELRLDRLQRLAEAVLYLGARAGHVVFELGHHARDDERNRLLDADL